jgi:hypothetical protein
VRDGRTANSSEEHEIVVVVHCQREVSQLHGDTHHSKTQCKRNARTSERGNTQDMNEDNGSAQRVEAADAETDSDSA